ncbi:MAG: ATP-dependent DNA ligase [Promethearchaeota archaeon]
MKFFSLCRLLDEVAFTAKTNEKVAVVRQFLAGVPRKELPLVVRALAGVLVPRDPSAPFNVGPNTLWKLALRALRTSERELEAARRREGDLAAAYEALAKGRARRIEPLFGPGDVTLAEVADLFERLKAAGPGSKRRKERWISSFLARLKPVEAKYFLRFFSAWLNVGLQAGLLVKAVAELAGVPAEAIRKAAMKHPDLGDVAALAVDGGAQALERVQVAPLVPVLPMLALTADSLERALRDFGGTMAAEFKYDGIRAQVHQAGERVEVFSRRLTPLTAQFPEVADAWRKAAGAVGTNSAVVEGELVGAGPGGVLLPFQALQTRVQRKKAPAGRREVPVKFFAFDLLHLDGRDVTGLPHERRHALLQECFVPNDVVLLASRLVTSSAEELSAFFEQAVAAGCEGLMVKDLRADYSPGTRGARVLKYKKKAGTFDLVVVGAEYGEGRKSSLLSRLFLAAWDEARTRLELVAKVSTGLTDEEYERVHELVQSLATKRVGRRVEVVPRLVVEVLADEALRSPRFAGGFALRFARLVRLREDLGVEDADDVGKVRRMHERELARKRGEEWDIAAAPDGD